MTVNSELIAIELTLRHHGPVYYGDDTTATRIAEDWQDYGFSDRQVDQWCKAYCWEPSVADEFRNAGMSADAADRACKLFDERYGGDSMYAVCNEDLDAQSVISFYKANG